jgi:hypothetical protein
MERELVSLWRDVSRADTHRDILVRCPRRVSQQTPLGESMPFGVQRTAQTKWADRIDRTKAARLAGKVINRPAFRVQQKTVIKYTSFMEEL